MRRALIAAGLALALCQCHGASRDPGEPAASTPAIADRNLFAFLLDDAGGFTPLPGSPFPSGGQVSDVESFSAAPLRNLLFVANDATNSFSALKFDTQRGELVPLPGSPYRAEGTAPAETAISGNFLFVGNATTNTISSFRLRDDGVPLQVQGSPAPTGGDLVEGMTVDPLGRFVLTANANSNTVSVHRTAPARSRPCPELLSPSASCRTRSRAWRVTMPSSDCSPGAMPARPPRWRTRGRGPEPRSSPTSARTRPSSTSSSSIHGRAPG